MKFSPDEIQDIKEEEIEENVAGCHDLIKMLKHEIQADNINVENTENIDSEYDLDEADETHDPPSRCVGFTDKEIAEAECRKKSFRKINAILAANKEDVSKYGCGTLTGKIYLYLTYPIITY